MKMLAWILFFLLLVVCMIIIFLYYKRKKTVVIPDEESGNTIYNFYLCGKIVKSIMRNPQGIKIYEVRYYLGTIFLTKSYDNKGKIVIQQYYYTNGQVERKIEYIKTGRRLKKNETKYDINGNKII